MEQLKEFISSYTRAPFLVRKNNSKFFQGYSHVICLQHTTTKDFKTKLNELGFIYAPPIMVSGKYTYRLYIKHVGVDIVNENEGKFLWVCPECGEVVVLSKNPPLNSFPTVRYVCCKCSKERDNLFKKLEVQ